MYNFARVLFTQLQSMVNVRGRRSRIHSGLGIVIALLICCLSLSLATRFCSPITAQSHLAKSIERRSIDPKRQHVDRDTSRWVASLATITSLEPVMLYLPAVPAETPLPHQVFDESLYNRPPPFRRSL
jgi:hypothetical protein